jgi:putative two-component system response regulator
MYNGYIWFLSVPEAEVFAPIYNLNILLVVFTLISVLIATAIMLILLKYLSKLVDTLIMSDKIIMTIANSIEAKDVYTKGHVQRVTAYALKVGEYFNLSVNEMKELKTASLLHDIGKIGVPDEILNKPGKLTNEEFEVMKNHTVFGSKILQPLSGFTHLVGMVRSHHEKLDGSGYPDGLKGEDIYITTRILTVIDIYDALITERPYKKAFTKEVALQILEGDVEKGYLDRRVFETFKYVLENYKTVGEFSSFRLVKKTK